MNRQTASKNKIVSPHIKQTPLSKIYNIVKYEFPILIILLIFLPPQKTDLTEDVYCVLHVLDYRIGFAPRLFIGSVMSLFTDYKSFTFMTHFMIVVNIITIVLFSVVAGRIIRKTDRDTKITAIIFVSLFIAVPYSLYAIDPEMLSLDKFLVVITCLALVSLNKPVIKWLVPLLLVAGLATYQGFAFTYMPVIAILLIYEIYRNHKSKQSILFCSIGFVTMAIFSAYFFLYPGISKYANPEALVSYLSGKTDMMFRHDFLFFESWSFEAMLKQFLFNNPIEFWQTAEPANNIFFAIKTDAFSMLKLFPIWIIFFTIWIGSIKNSLKKFEKIIYILCLLAPVARLPMFLLSQNPFRGRISVIVVQFFLILYFISINNPTVIGVINKITGFLRRHFILCLLLLGYLVGYAKQY